MLWQIVRTVRGILLNCYWWFFYCGKIKIFKFWTYFFISAPPLIWSLIKISKIPSDSPENFLLCNHCENIMPLLQTIIEIQHFPCLKIVKFCTLSNRSMKFPTSGNKNTLETCKNPQPTSGWSELTVLHNINYEFLHGIFFMNSTKQCQVKAIL